MTRSSNLELLRIVSMLYILLYHFSLSLSKTDVSKFAIKSSESFFHIGVICFLLISGYFGIKASLKGYLKLFVQCAFYSLTIYVLISRFVEDKFTFGGFVKSFLALSHTSLWFVSSYACLYIFSPIINAALTNSSKRKKEVFIGLLVIISAYYGLFSQRADLLDGKNVVNFVLIYCLGNYARHHISVAFLKEKRNLLLLAYLLINIFIITLLSLGNSFSHKIFILCFPYNSPILQLNAFIFFLIFVSFDQFKSKVVNWIAASMFSVYLIHESIHVGPYIYAFINSLTVQLSGPLLALSVFGLAVVVCILCVIIDKFCQPVIGFVENLVMTVPQFKKADEKLKSILDSK